MTCTMYYTSLKLELQTNNAWNSRLTEDCGVEGLFWAAVEQFTLIVFWHFRAESVKQVWTLTLQPLFSRHESECRNCGYGLLGIFLWNFSVVPEMDPWGTPPWENEWLCSIPSYLCFNGFSWHMPSFQERSGGWGGG